jgi:broad specificity phosphatase PhoE
MHLYLITHAATQIDQQTDATQWTLSAAGAEQVAKLARLPFWATVDRIVLSREAKTRLTVAPILTERTIPVTIDARLDELQRPGWVADYTARVRQAFADPATPAGEWESAAHALARVQAAIADLCQSYPSQTLALVGHGLTLSLYRAHLLGHPQVNLADWQSLSFAAVALVDPCRQHLLRDFAAVAGAIGRG